MSRDPPIAFRHMTASVPVESKNAEGWQHVQIVLSGEL